MPTEQTSIHCQNCRTLRLHTRPAPNHLLHAVITLFLWCFWIPIWIIAANSNKPFRCNTCGVINRHIAPRPVPQPQKPTDWHKNLKTIGLIAGAVGVVVIVSVFMKTLTKPTNQKTEVKETAQTIADFRTIFGKNEKELDSMFGKPVSVTKGTGKGEIIRNYAPGKQLLIRMKNGKSVSATMYLNSQYPNYRNVLQAAGVDTDRGADDKSKVKDIISAHIWNSISFDDKLYSITVFSSGLSDRFDAISMHPRDIK